MLLAGLKEQIKPHPLPTIAVFANRVKTWRRPTKVASKWIADLKDVCEEARNQLSIDVRYLNAWIPDRAAIRDAITDSETPRVHVDEFINLWEESGGKLK